MLRRVENTVDGKTTERKVSQNAAGTTTQSWNKPVVPGPAYELTKPLSTSVTGRKMPVAKRSERSVRVTHGHRHIDMIGSSRYVDCRCFFIDPVEISCDQLISGSSRGNYLSLYDAPPTKIRKLPT